MKKLLVLVLTLALVMSLAACGKKDDDKKDNNNETTPAVEKTDFTKSEGVMTYAQYDAANVDDPVTVETSYRTSSHGGITRLPSTPRTMKALISSMRCSVLRKITLSLSRDRRSE